MMSCWGRRSEAEESALSEILATLGAGWCSRIMPVFDTDHGQVYYRHWAAAEPRAAVIFLHGFGEHTGLYHRYGFSLNNAGIDLWAVDQLGHGLSPGERGDFGSFDDSAALAETLTDIVQREHPGLPLVAQGHSLGSVVTLFRLLGAPDRYRAGVVSGAPLIPVRELLDADTSFELDPSWLSSDPFYLDALEHDPLAFVDADGSTLTRELDAAWDRMGAELPKLAVPTLAIHGAADPVAPVGGVRAYAEQIDALQLREFPGAHHDVLNETVHREVAGTIVEFVTAHI
jgi:alpha-beta hydrolase superfamily lysophospholipase